MVIFIQNNFKRVPRGYSFCVIINFDHSWKGICMVLEDQAPKRKRVKVTFSSAEYNKIKHEAQEKNQSMASLIHQMYLDTTLYRQVVTSLIEHIYQDSVQTAFNLWNQREKKKQSILSIPAQKGLNFMAATKILYCFEKAVNSSDVLNLYALLDNDTFLTNIDSNNLAKDAYQLSQRINNVAIIKNGQFEILQQLATKADRAFLQVATETPLENEYTQAIIKACTAKERSGEK